MHLKLQKKFDEIETVRLDLLKKVSEITDEKFMHTPGSGKWSISQILTHIMISERLSMGYMKKKSLGIDQVGNSGVVESFKMIILKISQRIPLKYKAPKVVVEHTPEALSRMQLVAQWDADRQILQKFLETIEEKNIKKKIYKHPVAGRLDVLQALTFFNEHIHHHWPQVKRLL